MTCPCKVVGFGLMGAAVLILAGKSLTKTSAVAAPRSLATVARNRQQESQAISSMRSQSRQVVGSATIVAPTHPIGHAHERMIAMAREREMPSMESVMGRLRSRSAPAISGYHSLAQRRRARRSQIVGS